jgi:SPP1 family phage portal protein
MRQIGRIKLYTDVPEITYENVIEVLRTAYNEYTPSVVKMETLLEYEAGYQDRIRVKTYRKDIDNHCVDNLANEITEFKTGFIWGNPITLIQRGSKDETDNNVLQAIAELNRCYEAQDIRKKTQHLARNVEITGLGYTFVDVNTDYQEGDSYFQIESLDPQNAFVVYSSHYVDQRPMLGVITRTNKKNERTFTCFSKDERFEITNAWEHGYRSGEVNPLGMIPIVEWFRDYDRMGCFERQIPEMDNLNLLVSDFTNDVDQNTQAIWHGNDVEFPVEIVEDENGNKREVVKKPSTNDWMLTYTSADGKQPFVKPLAVEYDYQGMLNNIITRRSLILQKCNVPQRNDNSGGSTGIAMDSATGWSAAETSANKQQNIMESCKMEEVKLVLRAIRKSSIPADNPLNKLTYMDVQPNVKRQKTYELTVKVNAMCALLAHGISLEDTVKIAPLFEDPNEVVVRSGEGVRKYQEANIFKTEKAVDESRPFPDVSDQTENSPNING